MTHRALLFALVLSSGACALPAAPLEEDTASIDRCSGPTLVATTHGCLRGTILESGRRAFLGVPYALPPTGARRWRPPQPMAPWGETRSATRFAPACNQFVGTGGSALPLQAIPVPESEDCLYLNVWTPPNAAGLPVLFFLHGGADAGASSQPIYADDPALARHAVVVTVDFRMGPLGYLAHDALSAENGGVSGNWFLEDALAALRWVKANAGAFGGDPDRIAIFGQSGGGGMVEDLLFAAPPAEHLFSSAIVQSAPYPMRPMPHLDAGEEFGALFAQHAGCDPLPADAASLTACLRGKSVAALKQAWLEIVVDHTCTCGLPATSALVDGVVLRDEPSALLARGDFDRVPVVDGFMSEELGPIGLTGLFAGVGEWSDLDPKLRDVGEEMGIADLDGLVALYHRPGEYGTAAQAFDRFRLDALYVCMASTFLRGMADQVEVRSYRNSRGPSFLFGAPQHGRDLYFVFGSKGARALFTEEERALATTIQDAWTSVGAGRPSIAGVGEWPLFGAAGTLVSIDGPSAATERDFRTEQCAFFAREQPFP